ncbi:hypothetical protein PBV87_02655 [Niameybacter massiliensis]|uniref:Uncharacterized protein n=1 Tax=Holtiella tumoricola TaxID=3018743 RepID=A0AA42DK97_9FIRM|nr:MULTISPECIES: hypothetical protein [Lachnospirales]MDA3730405.1 hypothetical protein [Holtiella tumoricola]
MPTNVDALKEKYKEGYRCIHKDDSNGCTYVLRDFNKGKIYDVHTNDRMEIGEIDDFLDQLNKIKKQTGHDCICTGHECDD